eukprot:6204777-Pleurochrysis_carterae.AAC.14
MCAFATYRAVGFVQAGRVGEEGPRREGGEQRLLRRHHPATASGEVEGDAQERRSFVSGVIGLTDSSAYWVSTCDSRGHSADLSSVCIQSMPALYTTTATTGDLAVACTMKRSARNTARRRSVSRRGSVGRASVANGRGQHRRGAPR